MLSRFQKKQKRNPLRILAITGLGVLIGIVFFGLIVATTRVHNKKKQLEAHLESLEQKVEQMQVKNDNLKEGISESDNPEYIEKVAREELGLQQPGETVISFIAPESQEIPKEVKQQNILQRMIGAITGLLK